MDKKLEVMVTVTVLLFLSYLASARTLLYMPENEVDIENSLADFRVSDAEKASGILLPSEKPDLDTNTLDDSETKPERLTPIKLKTHTETLPKTGSETNAAFVPLTVISFRPMNRRFPGHPRIPFRHRHRCNHGQHRFRVPFAATTGSGGLHHFWHDLSNANDVILGNGRRRIPSAREMALRREMERQLLQVPPHRRNHHHESDDKFHYHVDGEEMATSYKHERGNGFMHSIRKFLNHL